MDDWRLDTEAIRAVIDTWVDEDFSVRIMLLNRGHWEDIASVIAIAQAKRLVEWIEAQMRFITWQAGTSGARVILEVDWQRLKREIETR